MDKTIELKGSILSLTVLYLYDVDVDKIKLAIEQKIAQAPAFFQGAPVVIEPKVSVKEATYLALLLEFLHQAQMIPIGIRTEDPFFIEQAEYAGLALFPKENKRNSSSLSQRSTASEAQVANTKVEVEESKGLKSAMVINGAVRSGQQIYAKERDLIVMGAVNPGAEVMADGHVHVFGKVMGKVFAGAKGELSARIFAKQLDPELVCIAGRHKLNDEIAHEYKQGFIEILLEGEQLVFIPQV